MIRRLVCRFFGHRIEETPIARGKVKGTAIGCTRCDTFFGVETERLPAMSVPRGRPGGVSAYSAMALLAENDIKKRR